MEQIIITIDEKGGIEIEADGFKGEACLDATREIEEALGLAEDRQEKPEMNEQTNPFLTNS